MSHQQVVEAAVRAAAGHGVEATVIVIGGNGVAKGAEDGFVQVEHEHYHHGLTDSEVGAKLAAAEQRIADLTAALTQRDETITEFQRTVEQMRAAPPPPAPAPAGGAQPVETVSIDNYSIDVLGITEEIAKKLRKVYSNIGALREAAANGSLKDLKLKGGQKAIIEIQERLLGKVPPERIPASAAPATATNGGAAADATLPAGHTARPWGDLLGAVKAKERDMREWAGKLAEIKQQFPNEGEMPDDAYDRMMDARHEHDIAKAQIVALVWALRLDKEHLRGGEGSVDACLAAAGLSHLTDNPQPRMVPEG